MSSLNISEEGSGESYKVPYLSHSQTLSSTFASPRKPPARSQDARPRTEPSSSRPSPPVSLSANPQNFPKVVNSPRLRPQTQGSMATQEEFLTNGAHADIQPLQTLSRNLTPTFASLGSPAGSQASLAIPGSPTFSSLVNRPAKHVLTFDTPENPSPKRSYTGRHHHFSSQSHLSRRLSTGSQVAVEQQLTQLDDDEFSSSEGESDNNSDKDTAEDDISDPQSSEKDEMEVDTPNSQATSFPATQGPDAYKSELNWALSQPESSQHQVSQPEMLHMDLLSQPASQFQHPTFPFHMHGPKKSIPGTQPEADSSLLLGTPAPLSNPAFAASTPNRQNWYQPPLSRTPSSQKAKSPLIAQGRPASSSVKSVQPSAQSQSLLHSRNLSKSKKFRSGVLQIMPAPSETVIQESQSYRDSSQPYQESFLLQTQAPYQSQSLSQF
ncbi:hypothetical protein CPB84DRAFT_1956933 [Gymnopilus junonius]|uniref:Uncharacterized protein n=1 Tax=Gymnopilus junonius TaxID=109634 RepID=A0A9P5P2F9_GYMJU|nr:hypothetical protein CPB84DRAFT_1956933 [Gymnopilus junonius]